MRAGTVARGWTALLLLAAVFVMHGVQCATAADGPGHATPSLGHSLAPGGHAGDVSSLTAHVPAHAHAIATTGVALAVPVAAAPVAGHADLDPAAAVGAATTVAGEAGAPFHAAGHLWTLCLAVLAAALAVLLASLVLPRAQRIAPGVGRCLARSRWPAPPRPPDLSALCLLRI